MEMKDPAPGASWRPEQFWVCPRCHHFWTSYAAPLGPPQAKEQAKEPAKPVSESPAPNPGVFDFTHRSTYTCRVLGQSGRPSASRPFPGYGPLNLPARSRAQVCARCRSDYRAVSSGGNSVCQRAQSHDSSLTRFWVYPRRRRYRALLPSQRRGAVLSSFARVSASNSAPRSRRRSPRRRRSLDRRLSRPGSARRHTPQLIGPRRSA